MSRTNCLERAGQIFITCIWIEKRLVDLIVLKKHPRLIQKVNGDSGLLPRTFVDERMRWWQKDFKDVKEEFISLFQPNKDWRGHLEAFYEYRNILGHGHVSLYRDFVLYRPGPAGKGLRRKIYGQKRVLEPTRVPGKRRNHVALLRLSDDVVFKRLSDSLTEFDEKYLAYEAKKLGLNYEKIR